MCSIEGCDSDKTVAREMCWKHYRRFLRHGNAESVLNNRGMHPVCETEGCGRRHYGKGLCHACYNKEKYAKRVAEGKCGHCGQPNDRQETTCTGCLTKRRGYTRPKRIRVVT